MHCYVYSQVYTVNYLFRSLSCFTRSFYLSVICFNGNHPCAQISRGQEFFLQAFHIEHWISYKVFADFSDCDRLPTKHKILQNQLIVKHKNIKMKQCNLTDMNLNLQKTCVENRNAYNNRRLERNSIIIRNIRSLFCVLYRNASCSYL